MAHTTAGITQVTYGNLYGSPQSSNRIVSYQSTPGLYYDMITSQQQQQQQHQLLETHSPKISGDSSPCTTRGQSPDHHQLTTPHIVTLGSPSASPVESKIILENGPARNWTKKKSTRDLLLENVCIKCTRSWICNMALLETLCILYTYIIRYVYIYI